MIDPRIYPLLQTLAASDLDWLVREIMDGLTAGHVSTASPEQMDLARELARRQEQFLNFDDVAQSNDVKDKAFTADEQVNYAANYTISRLADVIETMAVSFDSIGRILETHARPAVEGTPGPLMLSLEHDDSKATTSMEDLRQAREGLSELRDAITAWRNSLKVDGGVQ